ncbi:MAG TPA: PAS domain-containing protein [Candidatus Fournierella merdipullorum]|uniref:histidine kinase n=1 Tax=Candidatus Allofournierella merdipullorum TaxID=2838595 RepID=A0A9D2E5T4_9FIRM|nr:PAS domain-containing protein [Candidatus Fournierella merdipullorum]
MSKRIFKAMMAVTLTTLLVCMALFIAILFPYFETQLSNELRNELEYLAPNVERDGLSYLERLPDGQNRLTLIDADGTVLFDSDADPAKMENHSDRPEVIQAIATGFGESSRYSETLAKKTINSAALLENGQILRISSTQYSSMALLVSLTPSLLLVLIFAALVAVSIAYKLSQRLTRPLNEIDLKHPQVNQAPYDELKPLLRRLHHQNRQIREQIQQLQAQKRQFTAITDNMREGFLVLDADGMVLSYNSSATRLLQPEKPLDGRNIGELTDEPDFLEGLRGAQEGEHVECLVPLHGRICQLFANPVYQESTLTGIVLVLLDVTEQQEREGLRREFSANVSHELKTPLTSIAGIAEIMKSGMIASADIPHFAGKIYDESQRLIQLVRDIIRISQLDENNIHDTPVPVELKECASRTLSLLESAADAADVTLHLEGEEAVIQAVPAILDEMVYNLCENAVKYNRPGGSVTVTVRPDASHVTLEVADTGIGIAPEHHSRVFERFYRVDKSHSKEIGGTGLGLSIVKHGAAFHHAQVELESVPDKGTTIRIIFPRSAAL